MPGKLNPITEVIPGVAPAPGRSAATAYAVLDRSRLRRLARAMPDCQSAVLLCLAWQAALHERMRRGPFAGRLLASLSGRQLAELTGRPLRTVRHAIARLARSAAVEKGHEPGKKNTYVIPSLATA